MIAHASVPIPNDFAEHENPVSTLDVGPMSEGA
jgi:hypothetical protein